MASFIKTLTDGINQIFPRTRTSAVYDDNNNDLDTILEDKYEKPANGIPKTDLASTVQASLGLADSALQGVPNTYRTSAAQDVIDAQKQDKPTAETYTVATSAWSALESSTPFTYSVTVTATHTIGQNTVCELVNNNAVLFGNYGFAIGAVSGQSVTIYSIGLPDTSVTLGVDYYG